MVRIDRSGRGARHRRLRSPVQGPWLPPLHSRREQLLDRVARTVGYLRDEWPEELRDIHVFVAAVPPRELPSEHDQRWSINREERIITFYRLAMERSTDLQDLDPVSRSMMIEYCVFGAFAEFMGKEPWELSGGDLR